jgi:hypothetical protein
MIYYTKNILKKHGITFVEVMLAFLILALVFLPIFSFLTGAVKDTEKFYTETIAISRAKFIMDTMMFQIPWRCLRQGSSGQPGEIEDPKGVAGVKGFLRKVVPRMFGDGCQLSTNKFVCDGLFKCRKGFLYRARAKIVDLDYDSSASPIQLSLDDPVKGLQIFDINELVSKDADDKYNLIKKIVLQIKWSNHKGTDPNDDPHARDLFLVGFKSNLDT